MTENDLDFYETYVFIFHRKFTTQKKCSIITALMAGETWAWPVIGISPGALEALASNDYRYTKGTVCRAHKVARIDTARAIFENLNEPLQPDKFFALISENDRTVITTKSENKTGAAVPGFVPIDSKLGLFKSTMIAWKHARAERDYLRGLHAEYKSGKKTLVTA